MKLLALTLPGYQTPIGTPKGIPTGGFGGSAGKIVVTGIQILLLVAIILALFYLIYGGFKWMTSGGDQEKLGGARQTIIYAIIGLSITALSFGIVVTLGQFLGTTTFLLAIPNTTN